jgi:hypothetical protein
LFATRRLLLLLLFCAIKLTSLRERTENFEWAFSRSEDGGSSSLGAADAVAAAVVAGAHNLDRW